PRPLIERRCRWPPTPSTGGSSSGDWPRSEPPGPAGAPPGRVDRNVIRRTSEQGGWPPMLRDGKAPGTFQRGGTETDVRVLIADDKPLLRQVMREALCELGAEVVGEAEDGVTAVELAEELQPEVVLMDIRMPGMDGIEAIRRIACGDSPPTVVALTAFDDPG